VQKTEISHKVIAYFIRKILLLPFLGKRGWVGWTTRL